ncbi:hypothetical protein MRB53_034691 [Persea americana]|uniref:Uncharacterized protein n=1 Tax=Persea americana TaxID=3435 RepID=A0ACC2K2K3_PERAE|nr:hypothetical protein MRB53_034691 [Persea americana]
MFASGVLKLHGVPRSIVTLRKVDKNLQERDELLQELKLHLQRANNHMKQYADHHRWEEKLKKGDWVIAEVGAIAYSLALPVESKVHLVFHISLLKRKVGDMTQASSMLPPFSKDNCPRLEPLHILNYRWVKRGSKFVTEALVQWKLLPPEDATWEGVEQLQQQFPQINVPLRGGGGGMMTLAHATSRGRGGGCMPCSRSRPHISLVGRGGKGMMTPAHAM